MRPARPVSSYSSSLRRLKPERLVEELRSKSLVSIKIGSVVWFAVGGMSVVTLALTSRGLVWIITWLFWQISVLVMVASLFVKKSRTSFAPWVNQSLSWVAILVRLNFSKNDVPSVFFTRASLAEARYGQWSSRFSRVFGGGLEGVIRKTFF